MIRGDEPRRTRLHDLSGRFVGRRAAAIDLPRAAWQAAGRKALGRYPEMPWIPFPAIRRFEQLIAPSWSVLEVGAGMSTLWWAERVATVVSIEGNREWFEQVRDTLRQRGRTNVTIEHRDGDDYADLSALPSRSFDMIVADGWERPRVLEQTLRLCRRPGFVYLDDTDKAALWQEHWGEAVGQLAEMASEVDGRIESFTGLKPATVVACSGQLLHVPGELS